LDEHTCFLLQDADQKLRRTELLIEQHRLHMLLVHGSRQDADQRKLNELIAEYTRLLNYRQGLLARRQQRSRAAWLWESRPSRLAHA
jgi:hypothetical protein